MGVVGAMMVKWYNVGTKSVGQDQAAKQSAQLVCSGGEEIPCAVAPTFNCRSGSKAA